MGSATPQGITTIRWKESEQHTVSCACLPIPPSLRLTPSSPGNNGTIWIDRTDPTPIVPTAIVPPSSPTCATSTTACGRSPTGSSGDAAAMDDAMQVAYLKAYRARHTFRDESAFSTWLATIVYRSCIDELRRRRPNSHPNNARSCSWSMLRVTPTPKPPRSSVSLPAPWLLARREPAPRSARSSPRKTTSDDRSPREPSTRPPLGRSP